ncbi:hypothetical protein [Azospirillum argentinense]|uniref:Uncharacterized protein n=1 Tax=Azospirillum argentinense TaxID=2970906 RepID=A0A5B0KV55_9PROT|nr:hypothetical protein FH063_004821 [Azospirillum argentinense]
MAFLKWAAALVSRSAACPSCPSQSKRCAKIKSEESQRSDEARGSESARQGRNPCAKIRTSRPLVAAQHGLRTVG